MKAVKYFALYIFSCSILFSCKPKEQEKHSLHETTKDYFLVRDQSKYFFTEFNDTNQTILYSSKNFINSQANPDIENSEIMVYDLEASAGKPKFTVRCESGGSEFKDRIALLTNIDGNISIAAVFFNQGGNFSISNGSGDSIFTHSSYLIKDKLFTDVVRVKLNPSHPLYTELFFAKQIGFIGRKEKKDDKFYYVKQHSINK
jgi:hypothetical protein